MSSPPPSPLTPGTQTTATMTVTTSDLASSFTLSTDDVYPRVFSTARLLSLMEIAAARALIPLCTPSQLSVGARVDEMTHSAPTLVGGQVTATATYTGRESKLFRFEVVAVDEQGEVGKCVHHRAVVERAKVEGAAVRREKGQGKL